MSVPSGQIGSTMCCPTGRGTVESAGTGVSAAGDAT